ncbi:hypothetical protein C448_01294 [Halococcus morrhuae DSM 1307]|uniref:Uncharacterized protein n=1 Tax=Halococcus morrhuae DSM 1307 TaxID=931277 RepID=M0MY61_HALMO|nr:hypothetical protein C448_01294 [Halococcus morrhuae DSM 1307]
MQNVFLDSLRHIYKCSLGTRVDIFNLDGFLAKVWSMSTTSSVGEKYSVVESYFESDTFRN